MAQTMSPVARLWHLVREEKSDITAIYFFAILSGLIQLTLPVGIQAIIGLVLGGTLSASLTVLIIVLVLAVVFAGIVQVNQMRIIEKIQQRIFVRNSFAFAERLPRLDLKKADGVYLPELVNRFFETMSMQKSFAKLLLELPLALIQILFGLILLSFYHPFFILFGGLLLVLLWLILRTTGSRGLQSSLTESRHKYAVASWLEEIARLVKSFKFSNSGLHMNKADTKTTAYLKARTAHFAVLEFQYKILIAFKVGITAAMLVGGVLLLLEQQINIGQFVAAEIIIITIIASIEKIIINLDSVYDIMTAVDKISKLTDKPVETSGTYKLDMPTAIAIEANKLSFGFDDRVILKDLSFSIKAGEKVCITGHAGSGKSTLLKLLTGVYNEFEGQLLINKIPIANYDLTTIREKMGILFQQENIFNGTLWENLTMGKPATDKEYLNELCDKTGLRTFITSLHAGFDTQLDPAGKRLPRSVVQKILLVRALSHRPRLLIMEEPWLGIEDEYKNNIQQLILNAADTTVIIATADQAFSAKCNRAIQLED